MRKLKAENCIRENLSFIFFAPLPLTLGGLIGVLFTVTNQPKQGEN